MATPYEPVDLNKSAITATETKDTLEERNINTTVRYLWYGSALLCIIFASLVFFIASRYCVYHPISFIQVLLLGNG